MPDGRALEFVAKNNYNTLQSGTGRTCVKMYFLYKENIAEGI